MGFNFPFYVYHYLALAVLGVLGMVAAARITAASEFLAGAAAFVCALVVLSLAHRLRGRARPDEAVDADL